LLIATKLLAAKLHALYVKESEILESLESESYILPPTPQPWYQSWYIPKESTITAPLRRAGPSRCGAQCKT